LNHVHIDQNSGIIRIEKSKLTGQITKSSDVKIVNSNFRNLNVKDSQNIFLENTGAFNLEISDSSSDISIRNLTSKSFDSIFPRFLISDSKNITIDATNDDLQNRVWNAGTISVSKSKNIKSQGYNWENVKIESVYGVTFLSKTPIEIRDSSFEPSVNGVTLLESQNLNFTDVNLRGIYVNNAANITATSKDPLSKSRSISEEYFARVNVGHGNFLLSDGLDGVIIEDCTNLSLIDDGMLKLAGLYFLNANNASLENSIAGYGAGYNIARWRDPFSHAEFTKEGNFRNVPGDFKHFNFGIKYNPDYRLRISGDGFRISSTVLAGWHGGVSWTLFGAEYPSDFSRYLTMNQGSTIQNSYLSFNSNKVVLILPNTTVIDGLFIHTDRPMIYGKSKKNRIIDGNQKNYRLEPTIGNLIFHNHIRLESSRDLKDYLVTLPPAK
jgi:hypothetical protein